MDKQRKEQLEKRRALLQKEVKFKELRERISSQIAFLEKSGYPYKVYYDHEYINWVDKNVEVRKKDGYHGMHGDFQIDVQDSEALETISISDNQLSTHKFSEAFLSIINQDTNVILCYLGGDPELEISVEAFLSDPKEFFSGFETWVITTNKNWIIEYIWEQRVIRFIKLNDSKPVLIKNIIIRDD